MWTDFSLSLFPESKCYYLSVIEHYNRFSSIFTIKQNESWNTVTINVIHVKICIFRWTSKSSDKYANLVENRWCLQVVIIYFDLDLLTSTCVCVDKVHSIINYEWTLECTSNIYGVQQMLFVIISTNSCTY